MRFAYEGRGKSGSTRVCYVDFAYCETVYLITAYAKNQKDNLSKEERNSIKKAIEFLESEVCHNNNSVADFSACPIVAPLVCHGVALYTVF